ncbi:hypothetical protein ACIBCA_27315 [Kitasatospora sp. NPDC051170]|uniref:hypothetical protein n=1 Tax=Kitasatospora sp. NPDC051170 TaxID=3364056 RepID=UPI0037B04415
MSTPAMLTKQDEAIRKVLTDLQQQIDDMITAGRTVERIKEEVGAGWISGASSTFQEKIDDWMRRYHEVIGAFERFVEATQGASQIITNAEAEARAQAADGIYEGLQGA